ncbi:hypothetical protein AAC387_Pa06g2456 [Persea americana]
MHIRVRYQYHPRGSAPLFRGPTALSSVPAPARATQPYAHQGPVSVPPSRLGTSVQRANRPQLGACTSLGGTAICIRVRYHYYPRGSAPLFRGPTALSSVPAPAWAAQPYAHQGLVAVPPLRLGTSVQRVNRPQLGACTSLGGTAICISGSGTITTLAARRLCSEGQPPSARCLHQPGRHSHTHFRVG